MNGNGVVWGGLTTVVVVLAALGGYTATPGLVGALIVLPLLAALGGFVAVTARLEHPSPAQNRRALAIAARAAASTVVAVAALGGVIAVAGEAASPILLLAGFVAAPFAWTRLRPHLDRHVIGRSGARHALVEPDPAPGERPLAWVLESLSTPALCTEWQRSLRLLAEAADPAVRDAIVAQRRRYLDELERRDPDAVTRWLDTDPRPAATSPHAHLSSHRPPPPAPGSGVDPESGAPAPSDPDREERRRGHDA